MKNPKLFETALKKYTPVQVVGEGGSGRVFLVNDENHNEYAIKYLKPEVVTKEKIERFNNELYFSMRNTHPNILIINDYGFIKNENTKYPFYVMPYYENSLRKIMQNRLDPIRALEIYQQILNGLTDAHSRGIWHRDLKPENIFSNEKDHSVVVADFGIAHFSEDEILEAIETKNNERLANFAYAAPEQRSKSNVIDQRADIFSLGLILNELFTAEIPNGTSYKKIADVVPAYAYLDAVVDKMLKQSPKARLASIHEIQLEIENARNRYTKTNNSELKRIETPTKSLKNIFSAEVDISGRIDDLDSHSVVAISAGLSYGIMLPTIEKRRLYDHLVKHNPNLGKTRRNIVIFVGLLYVILNEYIEKLDAVYIDNEYSGYEDYIKGMLLSLIRKEHDNVSSNIVNIVRIDRHSPAREMARRVYKGDCNPDLIISANQIIDLFNRKRSGTSAS